MRNSRDTNASSPKQWLRRRAHITVFVLGAVTMPAQAEEQSTSVIQRLGSHTYAVPRDLIETIYKPDYSKEPNPNPNWPNDPMVRLVVQWPEFTAPTIVDPQEKGRRQIILSLRKGSVRTVVQRIDRLNELHYSPEISDASHGLKELRSGLSKEFREYIASSEDGLEYLIHCDQPPIEKVPMLYYSCNYDLEYLDLKVNVYFNSPFLGNWREIHRKTLSLLNSMRKD